jgi:hypothetical protein
LSFASLLLCGLAGLVALFAVRETYCRSLA